MRTRRQNVLAGDLENGTTNADAESKSNDCQRDVKRGYSSYATNGENSNDRENEVEKDDVAKATKNKNGEDCSGEMLKKRAWDVIDLTGDSDGSDAPETPQPPVRVVKLRFRTITRSKPPEKIPTPSSSSGKQLSVLTSAPCKVEESPCLGAPAEGQHTERQASPEPQPLGGAESVEESPCHGKTAEGQHPERKASQSKQDPQAPNPESVEEKVREARTNFQRNAAITLVDSEKRIFQFAGQLFCYSEQALSKLFGMPASGLDIQELMTGDGPFSSKNLARHFSSSGRKHKINDFIGYELTAEQREASLQTINRLNGLINGKRTSCSNGVVIASISATQNIAVNFPGYISNRLHGIVKSGKSSHMWALCVAVLNFHTKSGPFRETSPISHVDDSQAFPPVASAVSLDPSTTGITELEAGPPPVVIDAGMPDPQLESGPAMLPEVDLNQASSVPLDVDFPDQPPPVLLGVDSDPGPPVPLHVDFSNPALLVPGIADSDSAPPVPLIVDSCEPTPVSLTADSDPAPPIPFSVDSGKPTPDNIDSGPPTAVHHLTPIPKCHPDSAPPPRSGNGEPNVSPVPWSESKSADCKRAPLKELQELGAQLTREKELSEKRVASEKKLQKQLQHLAEEVLIHMKLQLQRDAGQHSTLKREAPSIQQLLSEAAALAKKRKLGAKNPP